MKRSEEAHHLAKYFKNLKSCYDDTEVNERLLKAVETLRDQAIVSLERITQTGKNLKDFDCAASFCFEMLKNPEHELYRDSLTLLRMCTHYLELGRVEQSGIQELLLLYARSDKAEENEEINHEKSKKNGQMSKGKSKLNRPILEAVIQFMQERSQKRTSVKETNEDIVNAFCKKHNENNKVEGFSNGFEWEVYHAGNRIYSAARKARAKTPKTVIKPITKTTLRNTYIPKAKKAILTNNQE